VIYGLRQVALHVDDLDRAVAFYRDVLGLRFIAVFEPPGLAFFDLGDGTRLLLEGRAPSSLLYLQVDEIHAAHHRLCAAGVDFVDEPQMIFRDDGGQFGVAGTEEWMVFFRDSEGNLVALAQGRAT
jgi:methylmalonyl-CoA/ethylmalonyl-CoA epimerase